MAKITSNRTVTFTVELTEEEALNLHNFLADHAHPSVRDIYESLNTELYATHTL